MPQQFLQFLRIQQHRLRLQQFDHLIQQPRLLSALKPDTHRIVHHNHRKYRGYGENLRAQSELQCAGSGKRRHGRGMTAGHTAVPEQPGPLESAVLNRKDQRLDHLRQRPCQERADQQRIAQQIVKSHLSQLFVNITI